MERQGRNLNRISWTVGDDHVGEVESPPAGLGIGSVQISGDFSGATVFVQISNDGSTWFTMRDIAGSNVSATSELVLRGFDGGVPLPGNVDRRRRRYRRCRDRGRLGMIQFAVIRRRGRRNAVEEVPDEPGQLTFNGENMTFNAESMTFTPA